MIEVTGLRKAFGTVQPLDGVDLRVDRGTVLGLLGPNGASKTSTVRVLSPLLKPDQGSARVAGFHVSKDPAGSAAGSGRPGSTRRWTRTCRADRT